MSVYIRFNFNFWIRIQNGAAFVWDGSPTELLHGCGLGNNRLFSGKHCNVAVAAAFVVVVVVVVAAGVVTVES